MKRFARSPFIRAVATIASGTAIAQALPIIFTPIISRLFLPEDFGVHGLFVSFVSMTAGVTALSFPLAIVSDIPRRTSAQLVIISLLTTLPMAIILVCMLALMMRLQVLGFHELPPVALFFSFILLVSLSVFSAFRYWQLREQQYARISRAVVSQSVGLTTSQLLTGILSLGGGGLIGSEVIRRCIGVWSLIRASWFDVQSAIQSSTKQDYWELVKEFRKFPILSAPSTLINSLALAIPAPLFVSAYGLAQAGQFSMSYKVLALPVSLIGAAVADVFHTHLARSAGTSSTQTRQLFGRVAGGLFLIGLIPTIVVIVWGQVLFSLVLGPQWELAGSIAAGIMPWIFMSFVVGPLSRAVLVFRRQEYKFAYDILALLGVGGGIWLGTHLDWSIAQTARLLGVTQSLTYMVYFFLLWRIVSSASTSSKSQ